MPDSSRIRATAARHRSTVVLIALYVACIVAALVLSAVLIAVTGGPWRKVFSTLLDGSLRRPGRWGVTMQEATPMLIVALGVIVSSRAGLVNIGQEGQLAMGAAATTWVAVNHTGPFALLIALAAGFVGGALWAGLAAVLRYWRKVPEVISTLLLVFVAAQTAGFLLSRRFLLRYVQPGVANQVQTSKQLDPTTRVGSVRLFGNQFPWTTVAAVVLAAAVGVVLTRTRWGFRLTVLGRNPRTAQRIGVPVMLAGSTALMVGGGMAGMAGGAMLAAGASGYRFTPGFSSNVGWEGLLVALVARNRPLACIPVAFAFGMLRTGSSFLAATGVPRSIADVVRALLVLALLVPPAIAPVVERRRPATGGHEPPTLAPIVAGAGR